MILSLKRTGILAVLLLAAAYFPATAQRLPAADKGFGPNLPAECSVIDTPSDQVLVFHTYAVGVQVYRWTGSVWEFVAPVANLYVDPYFQRLVASHFAGPTWMTNGGTSSVVAARVNGCTPDASAIPWLLLRSTSSEGVGIFGGTSFIQRVNTSGGLAPASPGTTVGAEARVPYTAEYFFYRTQS